MINDADLSPTPKARGIKTIYLIKNNDPKFR